MALERYQSILKNGAKIWENTETKKQCKKKEKGMLVSKSGLKVLKENNCQPRIQFRPTHPPKNPSK